MDRRNFLGRIGLGALAASLLPGISKADTAQASQDKIKVAVIEGWHPFEVIPFHDMFRSIEGINYYPQTIENWAISPPDVRNGYDVLLFYNMNMNLETQEFSEYVAYAINDLGNSGQGIFLLHHAILAYPGHEVWNGLVGIEDRSFGFHVNQEYTMEIANPDHPIAKGLESWTVHDETYTMNNAGEGSDIIFTAEHPKSMKTIGWTRTYRKSRVFCFQPGHDHTTFNTPEYRKVIQRGIQWSAGVI